MNSSSSLLLLLFSLTAVLQGGETRLTFDGNNKRDPLFIQDGETLVYSYDEREDLIRAVRVDMADIEAGPTPIFDAGRSHQTEIAYSADGRWASYGECTGNLTGKLVIRDMEAKKQFEIKHGGRGAYRTPAFTPDGKRVIYAFAETGPMQLWSVDLEAKDKKQLTETEGLTHWPSFTPDGKRMAYANSRENNYEIYIRDFAGGNEKRLTENRIMDIRPRLSPDGQRICFVSTRDGSYEVYVMDVDGGNVQRITHNEERDDYPSWHPNGRQLVYAGERDGRVDIYLVDIDPSQEVSSK